MTKNILQVVENDLCVGCGTCFAVCPKEALTLFEDKKRGIFLPKLDYDKCNQCGICLSVCPGFSVDFNILNKFVFGKTPDDILIGNFIQCYAGHCTDEDTRWNASSGGLVTSLLVFLLEEGIIDGALVTKMSEVNPLEPDVVIATTKEEIKAASQSKYCPVPVNKAVKRILDEDLKVAVVGLPCHIQGIRKLEMIHPKLRERIVLHLGLFCGHSVNLLGTEFVLAKLAIEKKEVIKIDYRKGEFPGVMSIKLRDGTIKLISHLDFWGVLFSRFSFFSPIRCTLCSDATSELADISFGTAWLPELKKTKNSVCISRTPMGDKIIKYAKAKKQIKIVEIDYKILIQAEKGIIDFTKKKLSARFALEKILNKPTPQYYGLKLVKSNAVDYVDALSVYIKIYLTSKKSIRKLLLKMNI